uniref:FecR family protein n=1 Tax=Pedobacter schmidteae TaxID=2201271 RepID=UPI000EB4F7B1|nr:FecR family protein [Pedobacter schmidteae]
MNSSRLQYLLNQYALNQCSKKELLELLCLINRHGPVEDLDLSLRNIWDELNDQDEIPPFDQERMYAKTIAAEKSVTLKRSRLWRYLSAAAILVMLLGIAFYNFKVGHRLHQPVGLNNSASAIIPGSNKATLRLANGTMINLNNSTVQNLGNYGNIQIRKNTKGQIVYRVKTNNIGTNMALTYNVLSTPKGGQYEIILADGSKVFLNANSSLTFPTAFSTSERNVSLKGEAYFEIAKNKRSPFKVIANGTEIKVLGTHFNVMAYDDEPELRTTLFEGSVQVSKNKVIRMIKPGQQATTFPDHNNIDVTEAKLDEVLGWRNGYFIFQDEGIESAMRKIARWYDVEIVYKGDIQTKEFGGKISRYENITDVLKPLELTGSVHFKLEGRRIIVMQ